MIMLLDISSNPGDLLAFSEENAVSNSLVVKSLSFRTMPFDGLR